ncbi:MAG: hypothetical protein IKJ65_11440 [Clostridia bacterium]|nr:hypothetical protein [Clostridia bacterium]
MNKKDKARILMRRKKEMQFAGGVFRISVILAAILLIVVIILVEAAPSFIRPKIKRALAERDFEGAEKLAGYIGEEEVASLHKQILYIQAEDLLIEGRFDEAENMFSMLGAYEDAPVRVMQAGYRKAEHVMSEGRYEDAAALFMRVVGYSNAMEMRNECYYRLAEEKIAAGSLDEALNLFTMLGNYSDSHNRRIQTAILLTGIEDGEQALLAASGLSQQELEMLNRLTETRERILRGWVAVGYEHTVARKADGTCVAAGDNSFGQTQVDAWTNVIFIDAGAAHTAALLENGTVVACGDNTYGQTDVSGWTNVKAIATGAYDTFAITNDGKLLHTGYTDIEKVSGWTELSDIAAGSYAFSALSSNGAMLASPQKLLLGGSEPFIQTDVSTAYAAALTAQGRVVSTFEGEIWTNTAYISCGASGMMAIDADGRVLSRFFRKTERYSFEEKPALLVAAGGAHHAVLYEDGSVKVYGSNDKGQANTQNWQLF